MFPNHEQLLLTCICDYRTPFQGPLGPIAFRSIRAPFNAFLLLRDIVCVHMSRNGPYTTNIHLFS